MQEYLLGLQDVKPPHSLKLSILSELQKAKKHRYLWPTLQMTWRTAMVVSIIVIGYWLGIETANGNSNETDNDPKINQSQIYPVITTPVDPSSLSEAYFKVVEEAEDEKR